MGEMKSITKHIDLIYDVGMHEGEDADYYLKKGFRVIGFEADPDLVEHCRNKFSKEIENGRLTIIEGAVVGPGSGESVRQTVKFYKNRDSTVWGTVSVDWAHRNEILGTRNEVIEVSAVNFTECLIKYGVPHYLKIDIEGLDVVCLRSLLNFEQKPNYVSVESEKVVFDKLLEELSLLGQLGYTKFKAVQQKDISSQAEPNPAKEGAYIGYRFQNGSSGLFGEDLPGKWKYENQLIKEYQNIFLLYNLFGNYRRLNRFWAGRLLRKILAIVLRRPIPGWYDTHAKHLSLVS